MCLEVEGRQIGPGEGIWRTRISTDIIGREERTNSVLVSREQSSIYCLDKGI